MPDHPPTRPATAALANAITHAIEQENGITVLSARYLAADAAIASLRADGVLTRDDPPAPPTELRPERVLDAARRDWSDAGIRACLREVNIGRVARVDSSTRFALRGAVPMPHPARDALTAVDALGCLTTGGVPQLTDLGSAVLDALTEGPRP